MPDKQFGLTPEEELAVLAGPKGTALALRILQFAAKAKTGVTCQECLDALGVAHQSGSARFHELAASGFLVATGEHRRTGVGGRAAVHKAALKTDFRSYLQRTHSGAFRKKRPSGLSETEQQVLAAGMKFLNCWKSARTKKARVEASVTLVNELSAIG